MSGSKIGGGNAKLIGGKVWLCPAISDSAAVPVYLRGGRLRRFARQPVLASAAHRTLLRSAPGLAVKLRRRPGLSLARN